MIIKNHDRFQNENWMSRVVLIVDDCRMTRRLLGMYVREAGFDVLVAENGLDALEKLGRESCDVVVTDLNMPHMDGIELTLILKGNPLYREIPVVMLTTQNEASEQRIGLDAGVTAFLRKPISKNELILAIKRAIPSLMWNFQSPVG